MKRIEYRIMENTKKVGEEVIITLSVQTDRKKAEAFLKRLQKGNALENRTYYIETRAV